MSDQVVEILESIARSLHHIAGAIHPPGQLGEAVNGHYGSVTEVIGLLLEEVSEIKQELSIELNRIATQIESLDIWGGDGS